MFFIAIHIFNVIPCVMRGISNYAELSRRYIYKVHVKVEY